MTIVFTVYFFLLGLLITSFTNVVGLRVPVGESIVHPRSHCPTCGHVLGPLELTPVLGYVVLGGKCRSCGQVISIKYPALELLGGMLYAYAFWQFGWSMELALTLTLTSLLFILTMSDLAYMLIPNKILLFFLPIALIVRYLSPLENWYNPIIGGIVGFVLLFVIFLASRRGMGAGDVKLFGLLGIFLGPLHVVIALFVSAFVGSVIGLTLLGTGRVRRKQPIPFVPSIAIGTLLTYYFADDWVSWYLDLLL
ncbi:prepilin peptidase [Exiguobacterium sp. Leaf187]|uniref:prepilin peptidase n=1 Tax=unclassified Exiguobacterium TaxID=2644629 RepID=UPI00070149EF|nr:MULTISPECIES: A24 family peptidase [unclassified Exiguobacterium]KQS19573.1 prepilin peptidase [Exiguobacterium sp. Leaf187]NTY10161.1 prepilin peptidase [Exiguobacterium sp. JMULE1]